MDVPTSELPARPLPVRAASPAFGRLRVFFALMVREMSTKFGRSVGGYLWAIAEPLGGILLLAIAFSLALRTPPMGTSFILFYATGVMPFNMYNAMSNATASSVRANKGLLAYPVVTALDAVFARFALNFLTISLVALILFTGIIGFFGLHVNLDLAAIALGLFLAAVLGLGVGAVNCVLFGFFPTWKNIWSIVTKPLFIASGVLFTYEMVPQAFQAVLWYNPLVHAIAVTRSGFYGAYHPHFVSYPYVLGIALGLFVVGAYLIRRHASHLIEQ